MKINLVDLEASSPPTSVRPGTLGDPLPVRDLFDSIEARSKELSVQDAATKLKMQSANNVIKTLEHTLTSKLSRLLDRIQIVELYGNPISDSTMRTVLSFSDPTVITSATGHVNPLEGYLTLSADKVTRLDVSEIKILAESNGALGNNFDRSRPRRNDIKAVLDQDLGTWVEYEKLSPTVDESLTLKFELILRNSDIVNKVIIDLMDFGTGTIPKVSAVQLDSGSKAELNIVGGSVFANFYPERTSKIVVEIVQSLSSPVSERQVRYVIGIKEVGIYKIQYSSTESFELAPVSNPRATTGFRISDKVLLQNPASKIDYEYMDPTTNSWLPVAVYTSDDPSNHEFIDLQGSDLIRIRGSINRDSTDYTTNQVIRSEIAEQIGTISESATTVQLSSVPKTFIEVLRLGSGTVGTIGTPYFLGRIGNNEDPVVFELPMTWDTSELNVLVNGERWPERESFSNENQEGYLLDNTTIPPHIVFGDGKSPAHGLSGRRPPSGAEIYAYITAQTKAKVVSAEPFEIEFHHQVDKLKKTCHIRMFSTEPKIGQLKAGPGQKKIGLPIGQKLLAVADLTGDDPWLPITTGDSGVGSHDIAGFRNGTIEFKGLEGRHYSTDWENSSVYFDPPAGINEVATINYLYSEYKDLNQSDYEFSSVNNSVILKTPAFGLKTSTYLVSSDTSAKRLHLTNNSIVKGSILPIDINSSGLSRAIETEVEFINGAQEFEGLASSDGFYSIDYTKGYLYISGTEFPKGKIRFNEIALEMQYCIAEKLEQGVDFDLRGSDVVLSPGYINSHAEKTRNQPSRNRILVRYDSDNKTGQSDPSLAEYYSPLLSSVTIEAVGTNINYTESTEI